MAVAVAVFLATALLGAPGADAQDVAEPDVHITIDDTLVIIGCKREPIVE